MKTKFGLSQISNPTPAWATYTFRIVFLLLSFGTFMITDYPGLQQHDKEILLKWCSGINMLTWGLSKLVGISGNENTSCYDTTRI